MGWVTAYLRDGDASADGGVNCLAIIKFLNDGDENFTFIRIIAMDIQKLSSMLTGTRFRDVQRT